MSTEPLIPRAEEASTRLFGSARKTPAVIVMFPPVPAKAWATIWLFCRMTNWGSIVMLPAVVSVSLPATEVLIWLLVSRTISGALIVIWPPLAWLASVVTELFCITNVEALVIAMLPALPVAAGPMLALEICALLVRLSVPTFIVMSPALPVLKVLLLIFAPLERLKLPTFRSTSPPWPALEVLVMMDPLSRV